MKKYCLKGEYMNRNLLILALVFVSFSSVLAQNLTPTIQEALDTKHKQMDAIQSDEDMINQRIADQEQTIMAKEQAKSDLQKQIDDLTNELTKAQAVDAQAASCSKSSSACINPGDCCSGACKNGICQ